MGYALQLYFDAQLEAALLEVRTGLTKAGVTPTLERLGDRPHVSLAVMSDLDAKACIKSIEQFAGSQSAFATSLAAFGAFPSAEGVVYLTPTPDVALLEAHQEVCARLERIRARIHEHYAANNWIPHVTMGYELPSSEVAQALVWLHRNFKPLRGCFTSVGLIEFRPVKELARFHLGTAKEIGV